MARDAVLSTLVLLSLAASLPGANIRFDYAREPTPGLAGHTTWTIRALSDYPMQGFDFAGNGSNDPDTGWGFFGPMNHVNPAGQPTVYSDNNPFIEFIGRNPKEDSQFLVRASDVVVPAGFADEGPNILQGIWAHSAPVGLSYDVAQLVIPNGRGIDFRGTITTLEGTQIVNNHINSFIFPTGQPPRVVDTTLMAAANSIVTHTFTATDADTPPESLSWIPFFSFNGPAPAIQPTFSSQTQAFRWDTTGSKPGTYTATVSVTDFQFEDTGTLTIHLVPEPAGTLLALLAIGVAAVVTPRRLGTPASASRR